MILQLIFRDRKLESQEKFLGDIEAVDDWCAHNKLTINSSKSKLTQFRRKTLSESLVALKGDILEYTDTDEILIDEDLTFRDHIDKVCLKLAKLNGVMYRVRCVFTKKCQIVL